VLNTWLFSCQAATSGGSYGIRCDASSFQVRGLSSHGAMVADIYITGQNTGPIVVDGLRGENGARLWQSTAHTSNSYPRSLLNSSYGGNVNQSANGDWINDASDAPFVVENCNAFQSVNGPLISLDANGSRRGAALIGVTQESSPQVNTSTKGISVPTGTVDLMVINWTNSTGPSTFTYFRNSISSASDDMPVSGGGFPLFSSGLRARGPIGINTAGYGLEVAEGTNAKQGTATLAAGTVTVVNTSVTANSRILLTAQDDNTTGSLRVSARTAGTSFTITSSVSTDTGVVAYEIFEPGE
jgi:hypothetical protein